MENLQALQMKSQFEVDIAFWKVLCEGGQIDADVHGAISSRRVDALLKERHRGVDGYIQVNVDVRFGRTENLRTYTPLTWAILGGHIEIVRVLLQHNADINHLGDNWNDKCPIQTALHTTRNRFEMIELLLREGADACLVAEDGSTCLHWVSDAKPNLEGAQKLRLLLTRIPPNRLPLMLAARDSGGRGVTPLASAIVNRPRSVAGNEIAEMLMDLGAAKEAVGRETSPLGWCVYCSDYTSVLSLLRRGANIEAKMKAFMGTALHLAVSRQHAYMVRLLLEEGADPHARDYFNRTPYQLSAANPTVRMQFDNFETDVRDEMGRQVERRVAFAMSQHNRLGSGSKWGKLDPSVMQLVLSHEVEYRQEAFEIVVARRRRAWAHNMNPFEGDIWA
jgi:ankyrin repeat protein